MPPDTSRKLLSIIATVDAFDSEFFGLPIRSSLFKGAFDLVVPEQVAGAFAGVIGRVERHVNHTLVNVEFIESWKIFFDTE